MKAQGRRAGSDSDGVEQHASTVPPASGPRTEQRPTMADVAKHVGVSRALVSIVFRGVEGASEATRAACARGRRGTGLPARLAGPGPAPQPQPQPGRAVLPAPAVRGRAGRAHVPGRRRSSATDLLLGPFTPGRGQDAVVDELLALPLRGAGRRRPGAARAATSSRSPRRWPSSRSAAASPAGRSTSIRNDDAVGTRQAVDHLVGARAPRDRLHRRRREPRGGATAVPATARRWVTTVWPPRSGWSPAATPRTRARGRQPLLADGLPTAVIAANDPCAIGVLDAVLRAGVRVPDDLSVVGYDDSRFGRAARASTSPRSGRTSRRWRGWPSRRPSNAWSEPTRKPKDVVLRPKLVVRGTTAAPRGGRHAVSRERVVPDRRPGGSAGCGSSC